MSERELPFDLTEPEFYEEDIQDFNFKDYFDEDYNESVDFEDSQYNNLIKCSKMDCNAGYDSIGVCKDKKFRDYLSNLSPSEEESIGNHFINLIKGCKIDIYNNQELILEAVARHVFDGYKLMNSKWLKPLLNSLDGFFVSEFSKFSDESFPFESLDNVYDSVSNRFSAILTYESLKSIYVTKKFDFLDDFLTPESAISYKNVNDLLEGIQVTFESFFKNMTGFCKNLDVEFSKFRKYVNY